MLIRHALEEIRARHFEELSPNDHGPVADQELTLQLPDGTIIDSYRGRINYYEDVEIWDALENTPGWAGSTASDESTASDDKRPGRYISHRHVASTFTREIEEAMATEQG